MSFLREVLGSGMINPMGSASGGDHAPAFRSLDFTLLL